ncbi:MAG: DUF3052 family protein [Nitratireductor sp.]|nr:DUF3052 family protein [Nitratireductor sp.]
MTTGYSGRPLAAKLGLADSMDAVSLGAPDRYPKLLGDSASAIRPVDALSGSPGFIHVFVTLRAELEALLEAGLRHMRRDGMIWVSWPKKSSGLKSEITEDTIREIALPLGLVDVKVCAVDETWSGLKLVIRKAIR